MNDRQRSLADTLKPGDKVVCVSGFSNEVHILTPGKVYTVKYVDKYNPHIRLFGCDLEKACVAEWFIDRFEPYIELTPEELANAKTLPSADDVRKALL